MGVRAGDAAVGTKIMEATESIRAPILTVHTLFLNSGFLGLFGWVTVVLLLALCGGTIVLHLANRESQMASRFFAFAHVQALVFVLCVGVCGIACVLHGCACGGLGAILLTLGRTLMGLAIGLGTNIAMVFGIALIAHRRPRLRFADGIGMAFVAIDLLFLLALMLIAYCG